MTEAIWAVESLRFFTFVVVSLFGTKALLWATEEVGVVAWALRALVVWVVAGLLGYV